ncbi:MAG: lipid-A-disaccharide synthase [Longimicrobiales bacterium]
MKPPTILLLAGEASGDNWGANLAADIKRRWPDSDLLGMGGPLMEAQGVELVEDISRLSIMGVGGLIGKLPFFLSLRRKLLKILVEKEVDLVVAIDFAGFNMSIIRDAHRKSIKVLYYVAPKVWAWGSNRTKSLIRLADHIAVIFPFEKEIWEKAGGRVTFVGHPVLDHPRVSARDRKKFCDRWNVDPERPILALFPGSRPQEISRHLDLFVETSRRIRQAYPEIQIVIGRSPSIDRQRLQVDNIVVVDEGRSLLAHSRAGLLKSGTVTLEACLAGTPFVTVYKTDVLTWLLAKQILKIEHISIPNLLGNQKQIPELLQGDATPEHLVKELTPLLDTENPKYRETLSYFESVAECLGGAGVARRVGEIVESLLRDK